MFEQKDFSFIYKYFTMEKQGSLVFLIVGIAAVVLAFVFFFAIKTNPALFKGLAVPLFAIGMLQAIAGYTVYSRSDKQAKEVAYKIGMEPAKFVSAEELPRMQQVIKNFTVIKWAEVVLFIAGISLVFYFRQNTERSFWYGLGITLAIQCALMFGADLFAESNAKKYMGEIEKFVA